MIRVFGASFRVVTDYTETDRDFKDCDATVNEGMLVVTPTGGTEPIAWYAAGAWSVVKFSQREGST